MTYMIVGGSSGLGRALAERFARAGYSLVLISSDVRDTLAVASDLRIRFGINVSAVPLDLSDRDLSFSKVDSALELMPPLQGMLLPAGAVANDDNARNFASTKILTRVNYTSICQIVGYYLPAIQAAESGCIVGFGSVASIRGRTRNAAYAASKRALASYFESLRYALAHTGVSVQFYVLGYLDTGLAFAATTSILPKASPPKLADAVFKRRKRDFGRRFYPSFWYPLSLVLRVLPWFLYRRLSF